MYTGRPTEFDDKTISNDGFFPDLTLGEFSASYQIPTYYGEETVEEKVLLAILYINDQLQDQKALWVAAAAANLAAVIGQGSVGTTPVLVLHYKRAVYSYAKGLLVMDFATIGQKDAGTNIARESDRTEQYYFAESSFSVRKMKGIKGRWTAQLI
jgi:hypothetical protein